ncbi:bifunctional tetrahydrofolate synthase/dihydrofolate synthase [Alteromonas gilva]|uniref:Dihydrofolate synthase/folylpolyglutamate synthase n=1 Tax=Alteromonas gilva TaxID=2987522 RepID=A0ABT5L184_9ALTE|nr:bifunctional tetrahydrofolate synthase/dihydrofolate synthase [Alteromonas gilva]MDC8830642.1 bifunctional tetrahydrofolate synthase/dihydrofolate synthase [Alteromonas gilva]
MSRNLQQWLSYLESIHPSTIDMGLERVARVASQLNIHFTSRVITVGGTNGKGTTSALIENALLAEGLSVGVYSSPHLLDYRERVRINNTLPSEAVFCAAFEHVETARGDTSLTYFEFGTLAAMLMLMDAAADVVILEVGLGGRLDATNIIAPDCAVITSIGLDHQDWLGDTREKIATEKAGIIRPRGKVVIGEPAPPETLNDAVKNLNADALWAGLQFSIAAAAQGVVFTHGDFSVELPHTAIPLNNVATAMAVLRHADFAVSEASMQRAVAATALPGRRQLIATQPATYLDVGHNPQATESLVEWLNTKAFQQLHIVIAMLNDKAPAASLAPFLPFAPQWYLGSTHGPRGLGSEHLAKALPEGQATQLFADVVSAYETARYAANNDDLILVVGSFHTVADILALPHNTEN